jgi:hypothetical protein
LLPLLDVLAAVVLPVRLDTSRGMTRRQRAAGVRQDQAFKGRQFTTEVISGSSDVSMAVEAMKAGASNFIEKPISHGELLACVDRALEQSRNSSKLLAWREFAGLTPLQRQVMEVVLAGPPEQDYRCEASPNKLRLTGSGIDEPLAPDTRLRPDSSVRASTGSRRPKWQSLAVWEERQASMSHKLSRYVSCANAMI